jgi:hypothetical protein
VLDALSNGPLSSQDLAKALGYSDRRGGSFFKIINELISEGQIAYTIQDRPRDPNQKLCRVKSEE